MNGKWRALSASHCEAAALRSRSLRLELSDARCKQLSCFDWQMHEWWDDHACATELTWMPSKFKAEPKVMQSLRTTMHDKKKDRQKWWKLSDHTERTMRIQNIERKDWENPKAVKEKWQGTRLQSKWRSALRKLHRTNWPLPLGDRAFPPWSIRKVW